MRQFNLSFLILLRKGLTLRINDIIIYLVN